MRLLVYVPFFFEKVKGRGGYLLPDGRPWLINVQEEDNDGLGECFMT